MNRLRAVKEPEPIGKAWREGWRPRERKPLAEWAEANIDLPESYAVPGPFRTSINRALVEPMNCVSNPSVREVYFLKPIQFGGSLIADIALPWIWLNDPGPTMTLMQSDNDMQEHVKMRLMPLFERCKPLRRLLRQLPAKAITSDAIYFASFAALFAAANLSSAQSKTVRWIFCDELWFPNWQKIWVHARGRVTAFERVGTSKITGISQAGNVGDVMDRCMKSGDYAQWCYRTSNGTFVPLLEGGKREDGSRWGIIWNEDARIDSKRWNIGRACETARYVCRETGEVWTDSDKTRAQWNREGRYVSTNLTAKSTIRSFAVNAILNRSLADLVAEKLTANDAMHAGNPEPMKDYRRKRLALPWEEKEERILLTVKKSGYSMQQHANGELWEGEFRRTMTIDRQRGREGDAPHWWVNVRAWRPDGGTRLLWFGRLETIEAIEEMRKLYRVSPNLTWQDAAFDTGSVYADCARFGWVALFGSSDAQQWEHEVDADRKEWRPFSRLQTVSAPGGGVARFMRWGTNFAKDILANMLAGRATLWELPDDLPPEYRKQLEQEHRVENSKGKWGWVKIRDHADNHMWDTEAMQVIAGSLQRIIAAVRQPPASTPNRSEGPAEAGP